jgi:REP element-mobilizing transposase RayT
MSFTNLKYHVVFSTKNRAPWLTPDVKERAAEYIGGIVRNIKGTLLEANGVEDHMHLVAGIHPQGPVSSFVRDVKSNSTSWIRQTFPNLREFSWQDEYSAFTVSQSQLEGVLSYVQRQEEHHRKMTFGEELRVLLIKHAIDFDERYLLR